MRCVVLDKNGNIVNAIEADPVKDQIPGHTIIQHDYADTGWSYRKGIFSKPTMATASTVTLPNKTA